jgi:hypothetical protein
VLRRGEVVVAEQFHRRAALDVVELVEQRDVRPNALDDLGDRGGLEIIRRGEIGDHSPAAARFNEALNVATRNVPDPSSLAAPDVVGSLPTTEESVVTTSDSVVSTADCHGRLGDQHRPSRRRLAGRGRRLGHDPAVVSDAEFDARTAPIEAAAATSQTCAMRMVPNVERCGGRQVSSDGAAADSRMTVTRRHARANHLQREALHGSAAARGEVIGSLELRRLR